MGSRRRWTIRGTSLSVAGLHARSWATHNDGDVQNHIGDVGWLGRPLGVYQLSYRCAQRVGQAGEGGCARAAFVREPHVTVAGGCTKAEGLRETNKDLAEHGEPEYAAVGFGAGIAQPVAHEQERGGGDDGRFGAAFVQDPDDEATSKKVDSVDAMRKSSRGVELHLRTRDAECEQIAGA